VHYIYAICIQYVYTLHIPATTMVLYHTGMHASR